MQIGCIIEARMTSKRLPGKVMLEAAGIPMLGHLFNRIKKTEKINKIILATTINKSDDVLCNFAKVNNIFLHRGSEENVMKRVLDAAEKYKIDIIVSITADCPLIDHVIINKTVDFFLDNKVDYVSNAIIRTYPDGMDTQVYTINSLKKSYSLATTLMEREHVTLHIRNNLSIFKIRNLEAPRNLFWPDLGLTLDEYKDYILIKNIIEYFYDNNHKFFSCGEIISYLRNNPDLLLINKEVQRK